MCRSQVPKGDLCFQDIDLFWKETAWDTRKYVYSSTNSLNFFFFSWFPKCQKVPRASKSWQWLLISVRNTFQWGGAIDHQTGDSGSANRRLELVSLSLHESGSRIYMGQCQLLTAAWSIAGAPGRWGTAWNESCCPVCMPAGPRKSGQGLLNHQALKCVSQFTARITATIKSMSSCWEKTQFMK